MKHLAAIISLASLITMLSGLSYYVYGIDSRSQNNSQAIAIFKLDKIERLLEHLKEKRKKQHGRLIGQDRVRERELKREQRLIEDRLFKSSR